METAEVIRRLLKGEGACCEFCDEQLDEGLEAVVEDNQVFCSTDCAHEYCMANEEARFMDGEARDYDGSPLEFADPGGNSSLRASGPNNPRIFPCPTCGEKNRLTRKDKQIGYQCDACADALERGGP